jgi:hypothetical protein
MAHRMTKRYITKDDIVDVLVDRTHKVLSDDVSIYSVHEFNRTLIELVVKECADIARREILVFNNSITYNGIVLLEEAIYKHFNMVNENDA